MLPTDEAEFGIVIVLPKQTLVALSFDADLSLGMATLGSCLSFLVFNTDWLVFRVLGYSSSV